MFEYKGYQAALKVDANAGVIHGEVAGIRDVVTFEATDMNILEQEFKDSVDDYLDMCADEGIAPNKPCSGKLILRMEPEVHWQLDVIAKTMGRSINSIIVDTLDTYLISKTFSKIEKSESMHKLKQMAV